MSALVQFAVYSECGYSDRCCVLGRVETDQIFLTVYGPLIGRNSVYTLFHSSLSREMPVRSSYEHFSTVPISIFGKIIFYYLRFEQGIQHHSPLSLSLSLSLPPRLINTMLVVDPQRRASLEQVSAHQWLEVGNEEDPEPVAAVADVKELPDDEVELILGRMVQGGYGSEEDIIR